MKKTKETSQKEIKEESQKTNTKIPFPFAKKQTGQNVNPIENKDCECSTCNNNDCKCSQIMTHLATNIELTNQIGHDELHNIFLTIFTVLKHLSDHTEELIKIEGVCQEVYKSINPKEMGCTIN